MDESTGMNSVVYDKIMEIYRSRNVSISSIFDGTWKSTEELEAYIAETRRLVEVVRLQATYDPDVEELNRMFAL